MMLGQGGYDVVYGSTVLGEHGRSVEVAVKQFSGADTKGAVAAIKVQGGCGDGEEVLCRVHRSGSRCVRGVERLPEASEQLLEQQLPRLRE